MKLLESLHHAQTPTAVMQTFDTFARAYGATSTCYGFLNRNGDKRAWSSTSAKFRERYETHDLAKAAPEFRSDTRPFSTIGFRLADGFPGHERDAEANRLYEEARAFGYTGEVFVPDETPAGLREFTTINVMTNLPYRSFPAWMDNEGATLRLAALTILARMRDIRQPDATPPSDLSPREIEVLRLLSKGHRVARIAGILDISAKTVEFHISNARRRLDAKTRDHAVAIAISRGFFTQETSEP